MVVGHRQSLLTELLAERLCVLRFGKAEHHVIPVIGRNEYVSGATEKASAKLHTMS